MPLHVLPSGTVEVRPMIDPSFHPGLAALLEFEEQRLGLPLEASSRSLGTLPPGLTFRPVVEINVHTGTVPAEFPVLMSDELLELKLPVWVSCDDSRVGFQDRLGRECPLAGVTGNRINVYFDLDQLFRFPDNIRRKPTNGTRPTGHAGNRVADLVLSQAIPLVLKNIRRHNWEDERKEYSRRKLASREKMVTEWRRSVTQNDSSIEDKTWEIRRLVEKNKELRERIRTHELLHRKRLERQAFEEHAGFMKLVGRGIRSFVVEEGLLKVTTHPIELDFEGYLYEFGTFEVDLPLGEGRVAIRGLEGTKVDGYPHPHVSTDGTPCFGNISSTVAQLLGDGDHLQALTLILEFLRSYSAENPYRRIEQWNPDWEDEDTRHDSCYDDASLSDCATCDDWDCPHRDGAESRCYEYTTVQDCIACAACDRHEDAEQACRDDHSAQECVVCTVDCTYAGDHDSCREGHGGEECTGCENSSCPHFKEEEDEAER